MLLLELLYLLSTVLLAAYGFFTLGHVLVFWWQQRHGPEAGGQGADSPSIPADADLPSVTVQLPIYNERHVVDRLIEAVVALDWPSDRLQVQVLDDSTDDTSQIIAAVLRRQAGSGVRIDHVCRPDRRAFKAGALLAGMEGAVGEFIAIFDADFVPPPDFLRRIMPGFADPEVGCIQARWGHVNRHTSRLTEAQALGIDGHFIVEQQARRTAGAFLNFNGTAGVWRRAAMEDAGGWQGDTLTEDLDLSYRAQLRGWRIGYRSDVVVPAELPVQIDAFKRQQFRWAKGSLQTAGKLLTHLWRSSGPLWLRLQGTLHLTAYAVHPLMILNLLLLLPMTFSNSPSLKLAPLFTTAAVGPPLMYWTAMQSKGMPWYGRLGQLGMLVALGTGLSVNNTRAALEAVMGISSEFKRTPKFAIIGRSTQWRTSTYALPRDPTAWIELALGAYAAGLLAYSVTRGIWWLVLWLSLYVAGYGSMAFLAFAQAWQRRRAQGASILPTRATQQSS